MSNIINSYRHVVAPYSAVAVTFDGTNDFLGRDAGLTGASDGKGGTFSVWINMTGSTDATEYALFGNEALFGTGCKFRRDTSNNFQVNLVSPASGTAKRFNGTTTIDNASGWHHLLFAHDGTTLDLYIDDTDVINITTNADLNIDYTLADWDVGGAGNGSTKFKGDMADFYYDHNYLDITVEANRRKFIDASAKPVDLGSDGSGPTGSPPIMCFKNPVATWHTNVGTGGGFTEVGALTTAGSSPSD